MLKLASFDYDLFKLLFHLWDNGGPNWQRELALFNKEEDSTWHSVNSKSFVKKSYAEVVRAPPLLAANLVPIGSKPSRALVFYRLLFPKASVFDFLDHGSQKIVPNRVVPASSQISSSNSNLRELPCPHYLSLDHSRRHYCRPIKCLACLNWEHIAALCILSVVCSS